MQFSAKHLQNKTNLGVGAPNSGNSGSVTFIHSVRSEITDSIGLFAQNLSVPPNEHLEYNNRRFKKTESPLNVRMTRALCPCPRARGPTAHPQ